LHWYRDRGILEVGENLYRPAWYRDSSLSFGSLNDDERRKIGDLVAAYFRKSEAGWEKTGRALLRFMKDTSSMLPCAEDLGVVPDCVPRVLESLGILGLRVPRWTRRYKEAGEPYVPLIKYPAATVCSASVHDTSTLREWWETEADRPAFWQALGLTAPAPEAYDAATAEKVVSKILETGSALAMFQLQDFLALEPRYRVANSAEERVNVPGTVNEENWSYRLPFPLEELVKNSALTKKITALVMKRRAKPAAGVLSATKSGGS
jgi:4-alpha-glucanotransferase